MNQPSIFQGVKISAQIVRIPVNDSTWKIDSCFCAIYIIIWLGYTICHCYIAVAASNSPKGRSCRSKKWTREFLLENKATTQKITVEKRWSKRDLGIFPVTILRQWSIVSCSDIFPRMPFLKITNKRACSTSIKLSVHFSEALKNVHLHSGTIFISEVIIQPSILRYKICEIFRTVVFLVKPPSLGWNRWDVWLTLGQVLSEGQFIFYQTQRAVGCPAFRNASDRLEGSKNPWKFWCRESCDVWISVYIDI